MSSHVQGFSVGVTREKGCLLIERKMDSQNSAPAKGMAVENHFKIRVSYDGSNLLYPEAKGPWIRYLTNALSTDSGFGLINTIVYQPPGAIFEKLELIEEYEDWHNADVIGRRPQPEYVVWLVITVRGNKLSKSCRCSIASRPARN